MSRRLTIKLIFFLSVLVGLIFLYLLLREFIEGLTISELEIFPSVLMFVAIGNVYVSVLLLRKKINPYAWLLVIQILLNIFFLLNFYYYFYYGIKVCR
ncbi:hypothetical protein ATE49_06530 [Elizabethkingia miricola]|uniref:Uncharacterized protein n=1 Tax=Elizabethkingia miricola TaxID=172045 RepID=A0ABY3NF68_ELIMR|nr:hypothetical protein [Elizabethkingia sp. ASV34]OBS12112.1 hypothetical protein ATE49_06530 [Elizabethkingia miricola]OPB88314.1 hypothetical protein BAS06_14205 [Elizabethkingia miricola]PSL89085.1 hypothetical protein C7V10_07170 [Elizabethkingia miricola]TYO91085.1 hypothetical protein LX74_02406 [Elizabethkingia miricola]